MAAVGAEGDLDLRFSKADFTRKDVPSHILDTKIYAKLGQNSVFQIRPETIHFAGYHTGRSLEKTMHIINASAECQRMHILPPVTPYFKIKYRKKETLVPGFYLEVTVEFSANEYGHYYDCIRIHSKDEENLIVPLHAYPLCDIIFPKTLDFKALPVGDTKTKKIPLRSNVPVDFEFEILLMDKPSAFSVTPLRGIIPGNGQIDIKVSFSPSEFCTYFMKMELRTSQFNSSVYTCICSGISKPGLLKSLKEKNLPVAPNQVQAGRILDPRTLSPLGRARIKKKDKEESTVKNEESQEWFMQDGIRFPKDLNNPTSVSFVLTQKAGKMKVRDLRAAVKSQTELEPTGKQMKEAVFEHQVQQNIKEEERNQLRWCVKLGESTSLPTAQRKVVHDREEALNQFKISTGDVLLPSELDRSSTFSSLTRVHRLAGFIPDTKPTFDIYLNDTWEKRQMVLHRFIQAAWKIVIRTRASRCLLKLSSSVDRWKRGEFRDNHVNMNELNEEEKIVYNFSLKISEEHIKPREFLRPDDIDLREDLALENITAASVAPTTMNLKQDVPFFNLVVPLEYKVLGYESYKVDHMVKTYTPPGLARILRTGADDESSGTASNLSKLRESEVIAKLDTKADALVEEDETAVDQRSARTSIALQQVETEKEIKLQVPQALLEPPKYHPLHIFDPLPGVRVNKAAKYDDVVSDESRLNQVITTERKGVGLDRKDIIPGVLAWKKFPCLGLAAANHMPSISNIYVPQWTNPVSEDILSDPPTLLDAPPEDDVTTNEDESFEDDHDSSTILVPSLEMITAQFVLPPDVCDCRVTASEVTGELARLPYFNQFMSRSALVSRNQRILELENYIQERTNRLGKHLQTNWDNLDKYR